MTTLIAAAAFFLLIHLLIAGTRLRAAIVGVIGEGAYLGLFSLVSIAGLTWLAFAYGDARGTGQVYWDAGAAGRHAAYLIQLLATLFVVVGLASPSPTTVKREGLLDNPDLVKGVLRITRHPFLWGVAIWAVGHLLVNGDGPSLWLFGSLLVLAVLGTASIDAKKKKALGDKWNAFAARTSNIPFAAIAAGRQTLSLGEIGWWRIALALAVWAGLIVGHRYIAGVPLMT